MTASENFVFLFKDFETTKARSGTHGTERTLAELQHFYPRAANKLTEIHKQAPQTQNLAAVKQVPCLVEGGVARFAFKLRFRLGQGFHL